MPTDLAEILNGSLELYPHPGQWQAWESKKRFIAVIAGTQSGKTAFGPFWLYREIQRRGPGDYLVVTPTFALLEKKLLPEFKRLFERWLRLGSYTGSPVRKFTFDNQGSVRTFGSYNSDYPTQVFFGYAEDPDSLESSTAKAAWLDEAGQKKFKLGSWEAVLRRLSIHQGRALITTTPYDLGWLKQQLWDPWQAADRKHPEIEVVRFDSTENPVFPQEEFERAKASLPKWKFDLFYRGIFTRPAGLIYDSFIDSYQGDNPPGHKVKRFTIPREWPRFLGLDFGQVNTAAVFFAREIAGGRPTKRLYAYREYHPGVRTVPEHVRALLKDEPGIPFCVGGSHSEDTWRLEFSRAGLPVMEPPIKDVEVGIERVYGAHKLDEILVFDDLAGYLEQKATYSRKLNDRQEVTEDIEDKASYHFQDAERYIISYLRQGMTMGAPVAGGSRPMIDAVNRGPVPGSMGLPVRPRR